MSKSTCHSAVTSGKFLFFLFLLACLVAAPGCNGTPKPSEPVTPGATPSPETSKEPIRTLDDRKITASGEGTLLRMEPEKKRLAFSNGGRDKGVALPFKINRVTEGKTQLFERSEDCVSCEVIITEDGTNEIRVHESSAPGGKLTTTVDLGSHWQYNSQRKEYQADKTQFRTVNIKCPSIKLVVTRTCEGSPTLCGPIVIGLKNN